MVTDFIFGANLIKLAYPTFILVVFHNRGWEDRNMDARVNTADDSDENSVNFGPVTTEFC